MASPFPLLPLESHLFSLLLSACPPQLTPRVAGGWVRDKLLGLQSDDIDVAVDEGTGEAFAARVLAYAAEHGIDLRADPTADPTPKKARTAAPPAPPAPPTVAVIQCNPGQSKHLCTATARIYTLSLDFVNLRSETYAASRIPAAERGTALDDAERRDFTLNSLFYNLRSGAVEDFTGRGLADLRARVLRTPLPPATTFRDDPLRALRAVRFASRFGLELDPPVRAALGSAEVRGALLGKVSRERVGIEVEGMLSGKGADPKRSFGLLAAAGLLPAVFPPPPPPHFRVGEGGADVETLQAAPALSPPPPSLPEILSLLPGPFDPSLPRTLHLAFPLLPWSSLQFDEPSSKAGSKLVKRRALPHYAVRDGLKLRTADADAVQLLLAAVPGAKG
ncbi:hypothetical protein TeGR_g10047, partial [Tetraparma gracilis]